MQRPSSIRLIWVVMLTLLLVNGWFALALVVPAQAHAAFTRTSAQGNLAPAHGEVPVPPQMNTPTPTTAPGTTVTFPGQGSSIPCLIVQVGDMSSLCESDKSMISLTATSLSQVRISGKHWPQGMGTLTLCQATVGSGDTCPNAILQDDTPTVKADGTFTQNITSALSFSSFTIVFQDGAKDSAQTVGITVTFTQGVTFALSASLVVAVLSLVVFVVGGGLRIGGRKPAQQSIQG